jgi:hypothetical protein
LKNRLVFITILKKSKRFARAYSGILSKFDKTWNVLRESVKTLYKVDKDEE